MVLRGQQLCPLLTICAYAWAGQNQFLSESPCPHCISSSILQNRPRQTHLQSQSWQTWFWGPCGQGIRTKTESQSILKPQCVHDPSDINQRLWMYEIFIILIIVVLHAFFWHYLINRIVWIGWSSPLKIALTFEYLHVMHNFMQPGTAHTGTCDKTVRGGGPQPTDYVSCTMKTKETTPPTPLHHRDSFHPHRS